MGLHETRHIVSQMLHNLLVQEGVVGGSGDGPVDYFVHQVWLAQGEISKTLG